MACCSLQTPVAKAVRVDAGLENIAIKHCRVATGLQVRLDNPVEELALEYLGAAVGEKSLGYQRPDICQEVLDAAREVVVLVLVIAAVLPECAAFEVVGDIAVVRGVEGGADVLQL